MGYCINLVDSDFKIKKENADNVVAALKNLVNVAGRLRWVDTNELQSAENIIDAFHAVSYTLKADDNGDYILDCFEGEKLGDDEAIFITIGKYVEAGSYLKFIGEDGYILDYFFNGEKCECD